MRRRRRRVCGQGNPTGGTPCLPVGPNHRNSRSTQASAATTRFNSPPTYCVKLSLIGDCVLYALNRYGRCSIDPDAAVAI